MINFDYFIFKQHFCFYFELVCLKSAFEVNFFEKTCLQVGVNLVEINQRDNPLFFTGCFNFQQSLIHSSFLLTFINKIKNKLEVNVNKLKFLK